LCAPAWFVIEGFAGTRFAIGACGAEPHPNYNRIQLSPVLAGDLGVADIVLNDRAWYADNGVCLHLGRRVARIDRVQRKVVAEDGLEECYDRLLLATGSDPVILPVPGKDLPGDVTYRDIRDTEAMIDAARSHRRAVTVVHFMPWLMERQLDRTAAGCCKPGSKRSACAFFSKDRPDF